MSYNAYSSSSNNYSPYYQQSAGQDGRSQYTEQSRGNTTYSNNSYQPLSAYQSTQPSQSPAPQSSSAGPTYNDQAYGGGAVNRGYQSTRTGYSDERSSVDTTALGNLAYASSLGRDGSNIQHQQMMGYGRGQNTTGYNGSGSYGIGSGSSTQYGAGQQRTDSAGPVVTSSQDNSRAPPATASPSFGYTANSGNTGYQTQQTKVGAVGQSQYNTAQYSQSTGEPYRLNHYSNPSRPSSGQAVQRPTSTTGSQGISPTVTPASRVDNYGHFRKDSASARTDNPRVPTPQQQSYPAKSAGSQPGKSTPRPQSKQAASAPASNKKAPTASQTPKNTPYRPSQPIANVRNSTEDQTNGQRSQNSTPTTTQFPTTVNPSQVFNDAEYQRRQAAAAAEAEAAKKKAEDARIAALPKENPTSVPLSAGSDAETAKKEQMELEMKQMIEKMRDYKSKDPSLFSQIWEQVKKGQPAPRASPQVATQGSSASPVVVNEQLPSPVIQLPPESEIPAAIGETFPPDFDRGRFPAQRRRRGGANFTPERKTTTPKGSAKSASAGTSVAGNQTMQKAMQEFHQHSGSPMPPNQAMSQSTAPDSVLKEGQPQATVAHMSTRQLPATPTPSRETPAQNQAVPNQAAPKVGGTYWPENKKRQLADAARVALISNSQNVGKEITTDEIHDLLNQNPSYSQMCETLEYRGFVIDRGQFARLLLAAVPDLGSASGPKATAKPPSGLPAPSQAPPVNGLPATSTAQPPLPQSASQDGQPRPIPYSNPQTQPPPGYVTPYPYPNSARQAPQAQMIRDYRFMDPSNQVGIDQRRQYSAHQQANQLYSGPGTPYPPPPPSSKKSVKRAVGTEQQQPPSSTKQDKARKRSFGEIVDLTQAMSDDEDIEPPSQRPRFDDDTVRVYAAGRILNSGSATPTSVKDSTLEEFRYKPTGKEAYSRAPDIVRPMNKRQDALRRSSYNPKTIARDILLAIGKHPDMAPLNSHLDVLREKFTAVNYESDLSTFRWDLVDPGGPPPVVETTVDEDSHQSRRSSGKQPRPRVAVVVGKGEPGYVEPGQGRRRNEGFKPSRGGHISSNARPKPTADSTSNNPQTPQQAIATTQGGITRTGLSDSGFSQFVNNALPVMLNPIISTSYKTPMATSSTSTPASGSTPRRRGRPPGARNKNTRPDKGISKKPLSERSNKWEPGDDSDTNNSEKPASTRSNKYEPGDLLHDPDTASTQERTPSSSLHKRPRISTTPAKSSGLRNAMSPTDGIAIVIPSRSPSVLGGSPAVSARSSARKAMFEPSTKDSPVPSYKVFECGWDKCPAELHNIDTLRKHVRKHRNEEDFKKGIMVCLWKGCRGEKFESVETWDKHVSGKHVDALAGESTRPLGDESSEHASDSDHPVVQESKSARRGRPPKVASTGMRPMVMLPSS